MTTIKISLNGKESEIKSGMTVSDLLTKWKVRAELVTVEVNENILQKLDYETTELKQGDRVEFVFYMGGGSGLAAGSMQLAAKNVFCKLPAASCRLTWEIT